MSTRPVLDRFVLFAPLYRHLASGFEWRAGVVGWAVDQLAGGLDTPNLRVLAGLQSGSLEVDEYFSLTLRDLDQPPIGDVERCLGEARAVAEALLRGEIEATRCADLVHRCAVSPLNHPESLQPWCDLDSGFRTDERNKVERLGGQDLHEAIFAHARRFVSEDPHGQLARILSEA